MAKEGKKGVDVANVSRFVFGLVILSWIFLLFPLIFNKGQILNTIMVYISSPLMYLVIPIAAIGIYFMFTSKMRWKMDIVALLLLAILIFSMASLAASMAGSSGGASIEGNAELRVTVAYDDGMPVKGMEIDVGKQTGPPPKGGNALTDENGIAAFMMLPGAYIIYFNQGNYPADAEQAAPQNIVVEEGKVNEQKITLKRK